MNIILTGDFNEEISSKNSALTKLIMKFGLIDSIASRYGFDKQISTYKRGSKCLDYIFVSRTLIDHITYSGYNAFDNHLTSDHQASFIDFSIKELFNCKLPI